MARRPEREGLDPYELAVLRGPVSKSAPGEPDSDGELPPLPKLKVGRMRVGAMGFLLGFLALFVLGAVYSASSRTAPELEPDCERPQLALAQAQVEQFQPLSYSYVGPDGRVLLLVDAAGIEGGRPVPLPGRTVQVIGGEHQVTDCRLTGVFGVQVPPGQHTLQVWPVRSEGTPATAGTATFEVLPER